MDIRESSAADLPAILAIINDAARAYRDVIPLDRWHEPYMPETELLSEIASGITFYVGHDGDVIRGVIGI
jgi:hypothetical protein